MHARPTSDSDASATAFLSAATFLPLPSPAPDWRHRLSAASDGSSSASSSAAGAWSGRWWWSAESQRSMWWRRVRLGTSTVSPSGCIVTGQVRWPAASHRSMQGRSYVCPVHSVTGSVKMSRLIGHLNRCGTLILLAHGSISKTPSRNAKNSYRHYTQLKNPTPKNRSRVHSNSKRHELRMKQGCDQERSTECGIS
uniref:Uncharacterized protein n=1 Tax=Arundo donax TaxID=35708 RepID=A0A0A9HZW8_ARUDO